MYVTKRVWRLNGASFLNPNGRVRVKEPNPHGRNQTSKVRSVLGDKVFLPCSLQFVTLGPCNLQGLFWNHSFCAITDSLLVKLGFVYKTLPKAQRTRGLSSYQYHKFLHKSSTSTLDQTFYSKSEQKFSFMTKPQLPNLQQTVANTILIINISSNSNNLNKFWIVIFTCQGQINQVY